MPLVLVAPFVAMLGILFLGAAGPLRRREIPPNAAVGLRTSATLADPEIWYTANAATGRDLAYLGILLLAAAGLSPWFPGRVALPVLVVLVVGGLLTVATVGAARATRLRNSRARRPSPPTV